MASNPRDDKQAQPPLDPNQKALNVWAKPVDQHDGAATNPNRQPTITEAVSTIKPEDFKSVANTPCARNGFLTGIASGFGVGGLRFILTGSSLPCLALPCPASASQTRFGLGCSRRPK